MSPIFEAQVVEVEGERGLLAARPGERAELRHCLEQPGRIDLAGDGGHRLALDLLVLGNAHIADVAGELLERVGAHRAALAVHLLRHRHRSPLAVGRAHPGAVAADDQLKVLARCLGDAGGVHRDDRALLRGRALDRHVDLLAVHDGAEVDFERGRMELRLRLLRLLQELLGAVALLGAAACEEERRADARWLGAGSRCGHRHRPHEGCIPHLVRSARGRGAHRAGADGDAVRGDARTGGDRRLEGRGASGGRRGTSG